MSFDRHVLKAAISLRRGDLLLASRTEQLVGTQHVSLDLGRGTFPHLLCPLEGGGSGGVEVLHGTLGHHRHRLERHHLWSVHMQVHRRPYVSVVVNQPLTSPSCLPRRIQIRVFFLRNDQGSARPPSFGRDLVNQRTPQLTDSLGLLADGLLRSQQITLSIVAHEDKVILLIQPSIVDTHVSSVVGQSPVNERRVDILQHLSQEACTKTSLKQCGKTVQGFSFIERNQGLQINLFDLLLVQAKSRGQEDKVARWHVGLPSGIEVLAQLEGAGVERMSGIPLVHPVWPAKARPDGVFNVAQHLHSKQAKFFTCSQGLLLHVTQDFLFDRARQITVHQLVEVHMRATTVDQSLQRGQILVETTEDELSHGALFLIIAGEIGRTLEGIDQHRFRLDIIFEGAAGGDMLTQ
mmetsp:Transcript_49303/g.130659  ORF Transcript_49303/g.130659 Transcript_49303/m.130659 type:complete len:407 (+) Transcript_49303:506-1726(+)